MNSDPNSPERKTLAEQWIVGASLMVFWAVMIMAFFWGCQPCPAAECRITWDMPSPTEQVTRWEIYRGIDIIATSTAPTNSATLELSTSWCSLIAVRAVNSAGKSAPAMLEIVPWVPQFPAPGTLEGWVRYESKTVFRERRDKDFGRYAYPIP
jgi:hypothetical protein